MVRSVIGAGELHFHINNEDEATQTQQCNDDFGVFLRFAVDDTDDVLEARLMTLRRADRRLDAPVVWAGAYPAEASVDYLRGATLRNGGDTEVRKQAIFWLGQLAGAVATADLADIAGSDPETEVRTSAVFALSQSEDDAAIDALIGIVRANRDAEVVRSALFWLGESGDPRVIALFEEILFGR